MDQSTSQPTEPSQPCDVAQQISPEDNALLSFSQSLLRRRF
jgi:hypothetical protein